MNEGAVNKLLFVRTLLNSYRVTVYTSIKPSLWYAWTNSIWQVYHFYLIVHYIASYPNKKARNTCRASCVHLYVVNYDRKWTLDVVLIGAGECFRLKPRTRMVPMLLLQRKPPGSVLNWLLENVMVCKCSYSTATLVRKESTISHLLKRNQSYWTIFLTALGGSILLGATR